MRRVERLRKLVESEKVVEPIYVEMKGARLEGLAPGEVRRHAAEYDFVTWNGRSADGEVWLTVTAPLLKPGAVAPSPDEVIEFVRKEVEARAKHLREHPAPRFPKSSPKPLGHQARTKRARETVAAAKAQPAATGTRMVRCPGCGTKTEVQATGDALARCSACGAGGL